LILAIYESFACFVNFITNLLSSLHLLPYLLFHNRPVLFLGQLLQEATKPGFSFFVHFVLQYILLWMHVSRDVLDIHFWLAGYPAVFQHPVLASAEKL